MVAVDEVVLLDGRRASFERLGQGPPMFALPGGPGGPGRYLEPFAADLTGDFTWHLVDLPGTGSTTPAEDLSIQANVAFTIELADALGIDRFAVLGHSYSGVLATSLAAAHPDRVIGAVLCDSPVVGIDPDASEGASIRQAMDRLFERHADQPWFSEARRLVFAPEADDDPVESVRSFLRTSQSFPDDGVVDALLPLVDGMNQEQGEWFYGREWSGLDLRPILASISCSVLSVVGLDDWAVPPQQARWHAKLIRQCTLVEIPNCGHWPPIEQPAAWRNAVRDWARSLPS